MTTHDIKTIEQLLGGDKTKILTLAEIQDINLADYWITTHLRKLIIKKDEEFYFSLERPTEVSALLTEDELESLQKLLYQQAIRHEVTHYPPGSYKGQSYDWEYRLRLQFNQYENGSDVVITLVDFGHDVKICINGVIVNISTGGGMAGQNKWVDTSYGFELCGEYKIAALQALIKHLN